MDELNHLGWVVYKTYRFAGHVLGIRTNSEKTGEWLAETFREYELDEETDPYYSLYMADDDAEDGFGQRFNILYRESVALYRSLDPAAVARRLVAELDLLAVKQRDDSIYIDATIVGRNGVNALVPAPIVPYIRLNGRKVERELVLPDRPAVELDAESARLLPIPQQFPVPESAFDDLRNRLGGDGAAAFDGRGVPDTVDVVCLFDYDPTTPPIMPLTRALAVYYLARNTINIERVGGEVLAPLAQAISRVPCYLLQEGRAEQAYELLLSVLDGDPAQALVEAAASS